MAIDADNLQRQLKHTHSHLRRGRKSYEGGRGQGGGVDTAGYALWTLEEGDHPADETTKTVVQWILKKQKEDGHWDCSGHRPPSEASDFSTTYLALRALSVFAGDDQMEAVNGAKEAATTWLQKTEAKDTEDRVFQLLSLQYIDAPMEVGDAIAARLEDSQQGDGGWSQVANIASDPYATATVMYALHQAGELDVADLAWSRGIEYLLSQQLEDGSWFVKSRSKPFQTYFETSFPHGKDQFISTSASSWATLVLLQSLPESLPTTITEDAVAGPDDIAEPQ